MNRMQLSHFFTYKYRYQIGYGFIIVLFISLLIVAGLYVPGGLSQGEMNNFVQTAALDRQNPSTLAIGNLPFYIIQRGSMELFGPSVFAFKLPALICAFVAGVGAVLLLRRWFRPNIAVLATIIMITTGQFLYVAQSGTASITYILWSIWLLLAATMITSSPRHKRFWKLVFFTIMPLSLYTPLSIYLVIAICSAGILHPHVRYVLKRMPRWHLIVFTIGSIIIAAPLAYLVVRYPKLGLQLLGAPDAWPPDTIQNLKILVQQYLNFVSPQSGVLMTPVLGLGSIALILLGAWQLFTIRYTARSYTLTAWIVLLAPVLIINPSFTSVTFVPLLLLLASGLGYLLREWYGMFPRNPYARFVGIVPLTILVLGLVVTGTDRYFDGYRYDPETASSFNHDVSLYNKHINVKSISKLVVTRDELPFYIALVRYDHKTPPLILTTTPSSGQFAATRAAHTHIRNANIVRIIATADSKDSDRFYIYKK
jgi:hypothetical protein